MNHRSGKGLHSLRRRALIVFAVLLMGIRACPAFAQSAFHIDQDYRTTKMGRSWGQGYAPDITGNTMTLYLPVRSAQAVGTLTARWMVEQPLHSPFAENQVVAHAAGQDGLYVLRFALPLHADRQVGVYACRVQVEGKDKAGNPIREALPLELTITKGAPSADTAPLRVTRVDAPALKPGTTGDVHLALKNTTAAQQLRGLSITLSDAAGDVLPAGADTVYRETLAPGEEWQVSLPLTVLASATARPHQLQLTARFLDMEGKPRELTERHTVRIQHEVALHHGAPSFPARVVQQSVNDYALTLMNMGDGDLRHVTLTFDVPGFAQGQSVLVGEIPRDESRTAKAALTAGSNTLGDVSGTVTVRYEDAYGTAGSFTVPLQTTVEEKPAPVAPPTLDEADKEPTPWTQWAPWGLAALLFAALVAQTLLTRRRIRHLEEDAL